MGKCLGCVCVGVVFVQVRTCLWCVYAMVGIDVCPSSLVLMCVHLPWC